MPCWERGIRVKSHNVAYINYPKDVFQVKLPCLKQVKSDFGAPIILCFSNMHKCVHKATELHWISNKAGNDIHSQATLSQGGMRYRITTQWHFVLNDHVVLICVLVVILIHNGLSINSSTSQNLLYPYVHCLTTANKSGANFHLKTNLVVIETWWYWTSFRQTHCLRLAMKIISEQKHHIKR